MNTINNLSELIAKFPGIGPRQAKRVVYFLLRQSNSFLEELSKTILELKKDTSICTSCYRYFTPMGHSKDCSTCLSERQVDTLMIVEKDVDFENIERSGAYKGLYFILGGTVSLLSRDPERSIRINELSKYIQNNEFKEIIIGLSTTPAGEETGNYIVSKLKPEAKVVWFGRGLSTGSELEYSDIETIKNAFQNRS